MNQRENFLNYYDTNGSDFYSPISYHSAITGTSVTRYGDRWTDGNVKI